MQELYKLNELNNIKQWLESQDESIQLKLIAEFNQLKITKTPRNGINW